MNEGKRGAQPLLAASSSLYWETRSCVVRTETASRTGKNGYLIKFTGLNVSLPKQLRFPARVLALRVLPERSLSLSALPLSFE